MARLTANTRGLSRFAEGTPDARPSKAICLLGGYGDVGLRVARLLHKKTHGRILLAGRNGHRAETAARSVGPRCKGMALDVGGSDAAARLAGVTLCVNLTEATPPSLAAALVANGTHFIDSSASPAYVADLGKAIDALPTPRATCVLETGLAPGLTNLLATRMCQTFPDTRNIDILIKIGMRTHHGVAATQWTLQALDQTYPMKSDGRWHEIRTGALTRRFATETASILGIGFAFSDQQSIARDLNLDGARTFLAVDPGWVTKVLLGLSQSPFSHFLAHKSAPLARAMQRLPTIGGHETLLIIEGRNARDEVVATQSITGGPQADMTAAVIAELALVLTKPPTDMQAGLQSLSIFLDAASIVEKF